MNKTIFKPVDGVYIVKRDTGEKVSAGGIYIPEQARERPAQGIVICKGDKTKHAHVGDQVFFNSYSGASIFLNDQEYLALRDPDLYAVIEEDLEDLTEDKDDDDDEEATLPYPEIEQECVGPI